MMVGRSGGARVAGHVFLPLAVEIGSCADMQLAGTQAKDMEAFGSHRMPRNISRLPLSWAGRNRFWNQML